MKRILCVVCLAVLGGGAARALCCTGCVAEDGTRVLVGNNEDYYPTDVVVRVRPASAGRHGCLLVGFGQHGFSMGGINDQGLFYDSFSVPNVGVWRSSSAKEPLPSFRLDDIDERCANVDAAIAFCRRYDLPYFQSDRLFVADASGDAAVIEWGDDDVVVIRKEGSTQVVTNFYLAHPERGWYPCWRFDRASAMLAEAAEPSWELFRSILSAVQQHWDGGGTRYSNIYELKSKRMWLFNASNFDEFATFDLAVELAKGARTYQIPQEYSDLRLIYPSDRATVTPGAVELAWAGKPGSSYQVCFGVDSQVDRCDDPETVAQSSGGELNIATASWLLGLVLAVALRRRRMLSVAALALIPVAFSLGACGNEPRDEGTQRRMVMASRLHTTYSWKIVARASAGGITTESIVRTFTTGD